MKPDPRDLLSHFEKHARGRFFRPGENILIACSGGPDSVALVHLLSRLASRNRWKLGILHFDHQLRRAAKADARFVRGLATKSKLPFFCGTGNVEREAKRRKISIEEAAREMRYSFFIDTAKRLKVSRIALAHTLDDQAETVLMRILQGTGLRGLQGIRETNKMGRVFCVRPLLDFTKSELLGYLKAEKVRFRTDASNDSERFVRNRIRLKLLPMLRREFNPRVAESVARIPAIVKEEMALLGDLEEKAWLQVVKRSDRNRLEFKRGVFMGLPGPIQFRVLERALKKLDPRSGLSFEAWERIRGGLSRAMNCWSLPKDIDLALTPKKVTVYKKYGPG